MTGGGPDRLRLLPLARTTPLRTFTRFVAIDWSGRAVEHPPGLAVAEADGGDAPPVLRMPPGGWSRPGILHWLLDEAAAGADLLVGLDLSAALPFADRGAYFPGWPSSPPDARSLWALVDALCAPDPHLGAGTMLADAHLARHFRQHRRPGDLFGSGRGRLRVTEAHALATGLSPTSSFNLVGAAQVGKASLTGMRVLHRLRGRIPVWPFDPVPAAGPLVVEIYTTIAARAAGIGPGRSKLRDAAALDAGLARLGRRAHAPLARYDDHATDALLSAAWLARAAADPALWHPTALAPVAATEGWTFGVR